MSLTAVDAISAMVAPVVLLTTGGLLTNGLLVAYGAVNDRMREMTIERHEIRRGPGGERLDQLSAIDQERLAEIEIQLPMMLRRHHLIRNAVLLVYGGIGVLGLSIIFIAVAVGENDEGFGRAALGLVLAGTVIMLGGLLVAGLSMARSADAITYAVERARRLGLRRRCRGTADLPLFLTTRGGWQACSRPEGSKCGRQGKPARGPACPLHAFVAGASVSR